MGIVQQGNRTAGQLQRRKTSIFSEYHYYASPPRSGLVLLPEVNIFKICYIAHITNGNEQRFD
jgi:hypothetical protein